MAEAQLARPSQKTRSPMKSSRGKPICGNVLQTRLKHLDGFENPIRLPQVNRQKANRRLRIRSKPEIDGPSQLQQRVSDRKELQTQIAWKHAEPVVISQNNLKGHLALCCAKLLTSKRIVAKWVGHIDRHKTHELGDDMSGVSHLRKNEPRNQFSFLVARLSPFSGCARSEKQRDHYGTNRANCAPSLPPHSACWTQRPALRNTLEPFHA